MSCHDYRDSASPSKKDIRSGSISDDCHSQFVSERWYSKPVSLAIEALKICNQANQRTRRTINSTMTSVMQGSSPHCPFHCRPPLSRHLPQFSSSLIIPRLTLGLLIRLLVEFLIEVFIEVHFSFHYSLLAELFPILLLVTPLDPQYG